MTKARNIEVGGIEVRVSNPDKVYFPSAGITKGQLVDYYLTVAEGAVRNIHNRPVVLKRYVNGINEEFFFQKRAPKSKPEWLPTVTLRFPSGRTAEEVVVTHPAHLVWMVNLGCIDLNPHPVRANDLEHPDELRVDLDPGPGVGWGTVREVTLAVHDVLAEHGLVGWPKTSGSKGMHVNVRIHPQWSFDQVRRAALALAREVERRLPEQCTTRWWKEERHGVFIDYNQNAKDRTVASAYSVRPVPDARVSAPLRWSEVSTCDPADYTLFTMPKRVERLGDLTAEIDESAGSLEGLLALSEQQEAQGLGDAPWPPHYRKQEGEPPRVAPSRRKKTSRRRTPKFPLITVAQAAKEEEARAGLERWRARYPQAAQHLTEEDVLVDAMRGRYTTWTRIRLNLRHVPEALRPPQEPPDPDYDPWA